MSAKETILAKLQAGRKTEMADASLTTVEAAVPIPVQARLTGDAICTQFCAKVVQSGAELIECTADSLPQAVIDCLTRHGYPLALKIGTEPDFAEFHIQPKIALSVGAANVNDAVAMSKAFAGSAETGTLALCSGANNPVTLAFLSELHLIVLYEQDLCAGLEGIWQKLRQSKKDPRTVNLITGPSRTADIEQTLTLGAHGPKALTVFLVKTPKP